VESLKVAARADGIVLSKVHKERNSGGKFGLFAIISAVLSRSEVGCGHVRFEAVLVKVVQYLLADLVARKRRVTSNQGLAAGFRFQFRSLERSLGGCQPLNSAF
jgi:hypothetical protein